MGRPRGSKNKLTDAMRRDIMACYRGLGGRKWLLEWAKSNETEFVRQALSRLMPPPQKPDEEAENSYVPGAVPPLELAQRLAFILSSGIKQQEARTIDAERVTPAPAPEPRRVEPPEPVQPAPAPEPEAEPQYTTGDPFKGPPDEPFPQPKRKPETLANYYGSSLEHAGPAPRAPAVRVERRPGRPRRKLV